jgi:hypothetical protein
VCLHNANSFSLRAREYAWWLQQEEQTTDGPVLALLVTEPLITDEDVYLHDKYAVTPLNAPSELNDNDSATTAIFYKVDSSQASITCLALPFPHRGISGVEVITNAAANSVMGFLCVYLPNRGDANSKAYRKSLGTALRKHIKELTRRRYEVVVGMDGNCPFKEPRPLSWPSSVNAPLLKQLVLEDGMEVMNWDAKAEGFFTRCKGRSGAGVARSELDLFLCFPATLRRMVRLTVTPLTFGSDHYLVDLVITVKACSPIPECNSSHVIYEWGDESLPLYLAGLEKELPAWDKGVSAYLRAVRRRGWVARAFVTEVTASLTELIIQQYTAAAPPREVPHVWRARRAPGVDHVVRYLVAVRMEAEKALARAHEGQEEMDGGAGRVAASTELARARLAVRAHLNEEHLASLQRQWAPMEASYVEDKRSFHRAFNKLLVPPPRPLPRILRQAGQILRRPHAIQRAWRLRFKIEAPVGGEPEDVAHALVVETDVATYVEDTSFDLGGEEQLEALNIPPTLRECFKARAKGKNGKAPGTDGVLNEMIKRGGARLLQSLLLFFKLLHATEVISSEWKCTPMDPLYKNKGDIFGVVWYRPIAKSSNLYKMYERWCEARIRSVLDIVAEQCGFRAGFSTLTLLVRVRILMTYCHFKGIDLSLAFVDFQEAFERVWRKGLLWRLWEAGVRGNMWRIVADMLTDTRSFVRTNHGDTATFETIIGVLMGSVLGPLLFLIFITPMAKDLAHLSPTIEGLKLRPWLFADDGLLIGLTPTQRDKLLGGCILWARKWQAKVKAAKTKLFTYSGVDEAASLIMQETFGEANQIMYLGVGIDKKGVFSWGQAKVQLKSLVSKSTALLDVGVRLGGLNADMGLYLFGCMAVSLVSHALPVSDPKSHRVRLLNEAQADFARSFLGLPDSVPHHVALAEMGLIPYWLRAAQAGYMLYIRAVQNEEDDITIEMMDWELNAAGQTSWGKADELGRLFGLDNTDTLEVMSGMQYSHVVQHVKDAVHDTRQVEWERQARKLSSPCLDYLSMKPKWGMDKGLMTLPVLQVRVYLAVRAGALKPPLAGNGFACGWCGTAAAVLAHVLCECSKWEREKRDMMSVVRRIAPNLSRTLAKSDPKSQLHCILGGGEALIAIEEWVLIQTAFVNYVFRVCG